MLRALKKSEVVHDLLNDLRPDALRVSGDFPLDERAIASFPNGTKVLSANGFGTSAWTITAGINVELPDGAHAR